MDLDELFKIFLYNNYPKMIFKRQHSFNVPYYTQNKQYFFNTFDFCFLFCLFIENWHLFSKNIDIIIAYYLYIDLKFGLNNLTRGVILYTELLVFLFLTPAYW